ncbi:hypothetical protein BIFGAL_04253 [Bifidobacterium gallicum DSM 20093 = LMG 11596]|uniref:Uncharacterized protein n=1 Tax=Bifidobacterium gallicum DSM 20093 = LMG 11596 TaxID=561180 RepID=D1NWK0_9BIFI|nr:hypothetical protein BIFGAL_04253 [Bifidobacterium gallicum DSM 20093 = LMG 11596]
MIRSLSHNFSNACHSQSHSNGNTPVLLTFYPISILCNQQC